MTPTVLTLMSGYFAEALPGSRSYEVAYEVAADKFACLHGLICPISYSGYRRRMYRDKKRGRC